MTRTPDGVPGHDPQPVADELARSGDHPDERRGRAEGAEVGPDDAPRTLVHHVGEQAHEPEGHDEVPRPHESRRGSRV